MSKPPRIWISSTSAQKGDVLRVRTQVEHVMESGLRIDAEGRPRPRNIIKLFEARLDDDLLFKWEPDISIAQNPYLEFTFVARKSGELHMRWQDEQGQVMEASKSITVG